MGILRVLCAFQSYSGDSRDLTELPRTLKRVKKAFQEVSWSLMRNSKRLQDDFQSIQEASRRVSLWFQRGCKRLLIFLGGFQRSEEFLKGF